MLDDTIMINQDIGLLIYVIGCMKYGFKIVVINFICFKPYKWI